MEVRIKNQELAIYATFFAQNNQFLLNLLNEIKQLKLIKFTQKQLINTKITKIEKRIENQTGNDSWNKFIVYFQQLHPDFENKLVNIFPDLKPAEKIELVSRIKSVIKIFEYQKCEIIFKNQELATHAVYISKNNSFLINLLSQINELQATTPSKNKLLKNKINQIEINIESQTNDNSWKRFLYYFQQIHPNFEKSLIENHSDLKPSDVKLAIFLRLNLSSKEIAEIAFLQVNSVKTARYRLRKKLKLATGDNLNSYLLSY